ncbi:MAG: hypothetical protein D5R98_04805 [Desulfonatronovibrio sp. MSAO_Bac4]|nr:MAG: hypothetical protein D5R98_04805 [Desulfonatronovibrio sp. MSAO_Bac4]
MDQDYKDDFIFQLREMLGKFPSGLKLSQHDLALVGWLYFWEKSTKKRDVTGRELEWQIKQAVDVLKLSDATSSAASLDRLLQYRLVRRSITETNVHFFCLTRLGRGLAEDIIAEVNLESDELSTYINHAYSILYQHIQSSTEEELVGFIRHVFLSSVAESIEYKLQSIEESILEQEKTVKELDSGVDDQAFELAVGTIQTSRQYLEELLQTLQTGSPYYPLYDLFYECRKRESLQHIRHDIESCLDFLDSLRKRIEQMLAHIISFIHECVAYQSVIGSLSYRDRLCRKQQEILNYALNNDLRMPVFEDKSLCSISMNWSNQEQKKPVLISMDKLKALEKFVPEEVKTREVPWKNDFLDLARTMWRDADAPLELGPWMCTMMDQLSLDRGEMITGLWLLIQDMPEWDPGPDLQKPDYGQWLDMGSFYLEPVVLSVSVRLETEALRLKA